MMQVYLCIPLHRLCIVHSHRLLSRTTRAHQFHSDQASDTFSGLAYMCELRSELYGNITAGLVRLAVCNSCSPKSITQPRYRDLAGQFFLSLPRFEPIFPDFSVLGWQSHEMSPACVIIYITNLNSEWRQLSSQMREYVLWTRLSLGCESSKCILGKNLLLTWWRYWESK